MTGPLAGLKVVEMVGLGPAPFCGMLLADMGAEIIRIDRPQKPTAGTSVDVLARGRPTLEVDLKQPGSVDAVLALVDRADALIEGYRPGVMEKLGLGPDICLARQPALVYGRMTGWGQSGPLAGAAGHDINYISLSGVLHAIGQRDGAPTIPLNYVGDFGGGGMLLAFGVLAALHHAHNSGQGQVVDAAMTDGSALLSAMMYGLHAQGMWSTQRGANMLDGGAHFYNVYACADGRHLSVGAIEPQFYAELLRLAEIDDPAFAAQMEAADWPQLKGKLAAIFGQRSRDEWCALLEGTDACVAPVLDWQEAPAHPHNRARNTFVAIDGGMQPAPAPRFSQTPAAPLSGATPTAADLLQRWQVSPQTRTHLLAKDA
ncbi:MAG TPA: CaiB/BaiF CoA-transferase family protein [Salinisphaeraceae bacterium]|nr:CaiB/BaiF CoA-transferase family protein [Salinisphaeraceae bacterium]